MLLQTVYVDSYFVASCVHIGDVLQKLCSQCNEGVSIIISIVIIYKRSTPLFVACIGQYEVYNYQNTLSTPNPYTE